MTGRLGCLLALLTFAWTMTGVAPARAEQEMELDEVLSGFDEPVATDPATEQQGDLEAILEGFDDSTAPASEPGPAGEDSTGEAPDVGWFERHVDVSGSTSLGTSYNLIPHYASVGPDPAPPPGSLGTYYGNLQRLRMRGDIQADAAFPSGVRGRIQAYAYYDYAYLIHGSQNYTAAVLQDYQLEAEILDLWIAGRISPHLDLKLGRQVVNWGRSDTLRVTDTLNALNNREPGLVDIEDLRLPSAMARLDGYWDWFSFTALVIPEIRYDYDPPPGNDFYPVYDLSDIPPPPPGFPLTVEQIAALLGQQAAATFNQRLPSLQAERWGSTPEYGGSMTGTFSGWDLSLYVARLYQNRTTTVFNLPTLTEGAIVSDDDRVTMVGAGGNYTRGSWLFKSEIAWFDELDYSYLVANPAWQPTDPIPGYTIGAGSFSRIDSMLGFDYYGIRDVTIALEIAYRRVVDYVPELQYLPNYVYQNNFEAALRVTSEHMHARLRLVAVGVVLANDAGFMGSTLRLSAEYELAAGLAVTGGYLGFFGTDQIPFDTWKDNDRLFAKLKFSF